MDGCKKRNIEFSPPDISELEIEEVVETLKSGWITTGPRTKLFEKRLSAYIDTGSVDVPEKDLEKYEKTVICLNSATAAEELNLKIWGIQEGDEVIVPAYTYTATASAAFHLGAKLVFVDIKKNGDSTSNMPEMDYEKLENSITEKTKAIVPVDLGGMVCDYDKLFEIVERKKGLFKAMNDDSNPLSRLSSRIQNSINRIAIIADCAHSLGAKRKVMRAGGKTFAVPTDRCCGRIADFSSFSFHAVKNFTTAEGGASTWLPIKGVKDAEIYDMLQLLSLHGQNKDALAKNKIGSWEYDIIEPWYKCNMTDITSAIGLRQLDRYPSLLKRRAEIIEKYDEACDEVGISHLLHHTSYMDGSNHLYLIRIPSIDEKTRNEIIERLAKTGISTNVHYKPLPMMTAYKSMGFDIKDYPNSYDYYKNLITLPLHTLLSDEDVEYVCAGIRGIISKYLG